MVWDPIVVSALTCMAVVGHWGVLLRDRRAILELATGQVPTRCFHIAAEQPTACQ